MRQQQQPSSSADSVGSGTATTTTTTTPTTAAEAARAARRNRIAGTGVATSPRANAGAAGGSINNKQPSAKNGPNAWISGGGSPSPAEVAAAFEELGMPSMNGTGNSNSRSSGKQNGSAAGANTGGRASAGTSTRSGSVRRSGNTILSSSAATGNAANSNAAAGSGSTGNGSARAAMPSPQDVADEFVGRRRLQQQQLAQQQQQQQQGLAGMDVTTSNTQNANANAARNNSLRQSTTSPIQSRNTAAVRNYVASSTNNSSVSNSATKANTTTPTRYAMVESPSAKTPSTSNRKQSLRVDTHTRPTSGTRSAGGTNATPHSAASPDTHLGSVNSSELGSLASPAAASTVADSLAYSQNTSKSSSGFGVGAGGLGEDMLSGQATNDIPATTAAAKMMNGGSGGASGAGSYGNGNEWVNASHQNGTVQPQPRQQSRSQMRTGTQAATTLAAKSVDDNFDGGTHGGGSIASRYDDLSKLSSRYNQPDRVMAPVDERPHLASPNGTSRSFDSYENKSHATHATAITYGQHDANNGAVSSGVGTSMAAANDGRDSKRDVTSIDVVTQSFSPTQKGNACPSSQASVGTTGASRLNGTFDDEDTNTVGSQLTDDRSWSRSVNLRQQQLRAQGRDYDDDADSRGSRRRQKNGKSGKETSGEGDLTGWALNADDLNHFREQADQPQVKAALGASAAVVAGGKSHNETAP